MELFAKIIREEKLKNSKVWRYNFQDIQTKEEGFFHNHGRIEEYFSGLVGKLNLSENLSTKTCQSFEPDIANTIKEFEKEKTFAKFVGKTDQIIKKLDNDFARKKRVEQLPYEIAKLRQDGKSWEYIAKEFYRVSERTIRRWRKATYKPLQKEGRKDRVSGVDLIFLLCYVLFGKEMETITQQEMVDYLYKERGIKVNQATICRTLKKHGIAYKRNTQRYLERKPLLSKIIQFMEKVKSLPQEQIGAIDECGFNFGGFPRRSYSRKGLRSFIWKKGKRGVNYTLILYIQNVNKKGVVKYQIIEGGMKTENLYDFLKETNLPNRNILYLMLDNLKAHHSKRIKELLKNKNIEPLFLVPYTPELNPVELCFNNIRSYVEDCQPTNLEELKSAIDGAIEKVQKKDLTKYFRHCLNYDFSQPSASL